MDWVLRQVARGGGFRVVATQTFTMAFGPSSLRSQLAFAHAEAAHVTDAALRDAILGAAKRLERASAHGGGAAGARPTNYAIVLERIAPTTPTHK